MTMNLYPEIESAGSLANAMDLELKKKGSVLKTSRDNELNKMPLTFARVEHDNKFSQVYMSSEDKFYLPDFWRDGVCLGHGKTDNITVLIECLNFWLTTDCNSKELGDKFNFVSLNKKAIAFDENKEVEYTWNLIHSDSGRNELRDFVELAMKDNVLCALFPFTSLMTLCFSRCTGYPYTYDTPTVSPFENDKYLVRQSNGNIIGSGTAEEAIKMVKDNLPNDIKPAVRGTSETL